MPRMLQQLSGRPRTMIGSDEAQSFVKAALVQLEDRHSALLSAEYRARKAESDTAPVIDVPDLLAPFADLVDSLLPHLRWAGVNTHDASNVRCEFYAAGSKTGPPIDIDDLSAGEKAAISLMLPFVEQQADQLAAGHTPTLGLTPVTLLLDEPEIHLHPLLQLQVLDYLRRLAAENVAQFILTTHSTTLLDALDDSELWLLSPASLRPDNQLSRLTTASERLEVARTITGSTHLLTRAKPIVFVEGEAPRAGLATDVRLAAALLPQMSSWALVAGGAKTDVIKSVRGLRQQHLDLPGMPVFGLVDADRDPDPTEEHVIAWPVAMIENLLLDPEAIYEALRPLGSLTLASSAQAVADVLTRAVSDRVQEEIDLRIRQQLPLGRLVLLPHQLDDVPAVAATQVQEWQAKVAEVDPVRLVERAGQDVRNILDSGQALERFHGKRLLQMVQLNLGARQVMPEPAFHMTIAAHAAGTDRIKRLAQPALDRIQLYMPNGIGANLRAAAASGALLGDAPDLIGDAEAEGLAQQCETARSEWLNGKPTAEGRESLRDRIFAYARLMTEPNHEVLARLASQIGTP